MLRRIALAVNAFLGQRLDDFVLLVLAMMIDDDDSHDDDDDKTIQTSQNSPNSLRNPNGPLPTERRRNYAAHISGHTRSNPTAAHKFNSTDRDTDSTASSTACRITNENHPTNSE
jgi:hypothetical protein